MTQGSTGRHGGRLRYQVAASLDGYIAGPRGEADWIPMDPDIDFGALFAQFDTILIGRRTYETVLQGQGDVGPFDMRTFVCSRTLNPADHPEVTVLADRIGERVAELKSSVRKDVWLFGGGELFRSLARLGLVDTVEVAVVPVLLGGGVPLLPAPANRMDLELTGRHVYEKSGIVLLEYAIRRAENSSSG